MKRRAGGTNKGEVCLLFAKGRKNAGYVCSVF
jgi:hypothetical protein